MSLSRLSNCNQGSPAQVFSLRIKFFTNRKGIFDINMTISQQFTIYYLRLLMKGVPDFLIYEVDPEVSERLPRILQESERELRRFPFFEFSSKDGREVILSIRDIQMANFLWEHGLKPNNHDDESAIDSVGIQLYFRGRPKPFETSAADPAQLGHIFEQLGLVDLERDSFLMFEDEDGEMVWFRPGDLVLLSAPAWLVNLEEGANEEW
jgi:hypothetical protein